MMKTIKEVLKQGEIYLTKHGVGYPRREMEALLMHALRMKRMDLYLDWDRPLQPEEVACLRSWTMRRAQKEPIAYIVGEVDFLDCSIEVTPDVLIPRQETEILVDRIVHEIAKEAYHGKILLDLCTGSGCIAIAIKKKLPALSVLGSDICPLAVAIAKRNSEKNRVHVEYRVGDFLFSFVDKKINYLVCNPPYVCPIEYEQLEPEVRQFEPKKALVADSQGLKYYLLLKDFLTDLILPQGKVWLEIGSEQKSAMEDILGSLPGFKHQIFQDLSGKDRFFFLERE